MAEFRVGRSWGVTVIHDPEGGEKTGELWATAQNREYAERIVAALNASAPMVDSELGDKVRKAITAWHTNPVDATILTNAVMAVVTPELKAAFLRGHDAGADNPWVEQKPVVDSELRDRFALELDGDVSEFINPNEFGGYDVDFARLAEIANEFYAPALKDAYLKGHEAGFAAANVDDPWAETPAVDANLVDLVALIQQELELAHSGEGYEPKAVAEQIVKDRVAPVLAETREGNAAALKLWQDATRQWNADVAERDAKLAESVRNEEAMIRDRDHAEGWADRLSYAIAPRSEIGEHSSANNPWANALEIADRRAVEIEQLRNQVQLLADACQRSAYTDKDLIARESQIRDLIRELDLAVATRQQYQEERDAAETEARQVRAQRDNAWVDRLRWVETAEKRADEIARLRAELEACQRRGQADRWRRPVSEASEETEECKPSTVSVESAGEIESERSVSPATPAEPRPNRPVYEDPGDVEYEYDEDGKPQDPAVRWPIAWGCTVSIGQYDGELHFTVSISDDVQRDGIAVRSVTREQIRAYAHHLIKLTEVVVDQPGGDQ